MSNNARTPIGFVDNYGYVTPFNGRIVDNMPGRYIYTQAEMDFYLGQQQLLEADRRATRFGETPNQDNDVVNDGVVPENAMSVPTPPIPPQVVAKPMDPTIPPTYMNLTPEQKEQLPAGINTKAAVAHVMNTK